jgi:hypothetical protein
VHGQAEAALAAVRLLVQQHRLVGEVAVAAAVLRRHAEAEQAQLARQPVVLAVGVALPFEALGVREHLLGEEAARQLGEVGVLRLLPRRGVPVQSGGRHGATLPSCWRCVNNVCRMVTR